MATKPAWPSLSQAACKGTTDAKVKSNVKALQCLLNYRNGNTALLDDGDFGATTTTAVKGYQSKNGLLADGVAGPITLSHLIVDVKSVANGQAAKAAQHLLGKFATILVDGNFGSTSDGIAKAFQGKMGLVQDGLIGPISWQYLFGYIAYPTTAISSTGVHFTAPGWPMLSKANCNGSKNTRVIANVKALQCLLNYRNSSNLLIDGDFGDLTVTQVKAFQKAKGLVQDGEAGEKTLPLLVAVITGTVTSAIGMAAQLLLSKFCIIAVDGVYGLVSQNLLIKTKQTMGLPAAGTVDIQTWQHLFGDDVSQNSGTGTLHVWPTTTTAQTFSDAEVEVNARYIYNFLRSKGFTKQAACGVLGNMEVESHLNPGAWEAGGAAYPNKGYGLLQWTPCTDFLTWAFNNKRITAASATAVDSHAKIGGHGLMDAELDFLIASCTSSPAPGGMRYLSIKSNPKFQNKSADGQVNFMTYTEYINSFAPAKVLAIVFHNHYVRSNNALTERGNLAAKWFGKLAQ